MSDQMEKAIAAIRTGKVSPYSAFKMVDNITESQKAVLRAENDKMLRGVSDHQDKMARVMRRGF